MVKSLILEFLKERARDHLLLLEYLSRDIGEMNRIRERHSDDWKMEELTRAIIIDEAQIFE